MNLHYQTNLKQSQELSQIQLQSLQILSFDSYELNEFLQKEYLDNPFLEYEQRVHFPAWNQYASYTENTNEDAFCQELPAPESSNIETFLLEQLAPGKFTKEQWAVMRLLISFLDEDGYFRYSTKELGERLGIDAFLVRECLDVLSSLEPCGIFSKDLPHFLLKQLEQKKSLTPTLNRLIRYHLTDIAEGKISKIARGLQVPAAEIRQSISIIQDLRPRPLSGFSAPNAGYVTPDILLTLQNGEPQITLNDQWIGNYSLSDYYLNAIQHTCDSDTKKYLLQKYNRCQLILRSIEQRRSSLLKITEAIFHRQSCFLLEKGPLAPMVLADIADDIQMHFSTVSRGIRNKYIQTPIGIFSLKSTFAAGSGTNKQNSTDEIRRRIRCLIDNETPSKPYSDSAISELLKKEGIQISRRTVAKYRDELGIKGMFDRIR